MDDRLFDTYISYLDAESQAGSSPPHVHLVGAAFNSVKAARRGQGGGEKKAAEEVDAIVERHSLMIHAAAAVGNTAVLVLSPIPTDHPDLEPFLEDLAVKLQALCAARGPVAKYIPFREV